MQSVRRALTATLVAVLATAALATPARGAGGKVNINTASSEQLELLPRVGPAVAGRIIEFREQNGPFKKPEDLMLVRGIGEKTFALIEPHITLSGDTTLSEKVRATRAAGDGETD